MSNVKSICQMLNLNAIEKNSKSEILNPKQNPKSQIPNPKRLEFVI